MQKSGTIHKIFDTQKISEKFRKRELILNFSDGKYDQFVPFEFVQENVILLDRFRTGDNVIITFDLKGRMWISPQGEAKYFGSNQAWKIEKEGTEPEQTTEDEADGLPF